jgi:hypothetical protein
MPPSLRITANWEHLGEGSPEERACFAEVGIFNQNCCLTEGVDGLVNRIRSEPLLSAYHLAEWLVWNWWRLRWEPRSEASDWAFAHRMTTIGEGYAWPNITIFSDGERTALIAKPTTAAQTPTFRYLADVPAVVPSREFEWAVDAFIGQVLGQLDAEGLRETNLSRLWSDLQAERHDPELGRRRKLEALLGHDPNEADPAIIDRLIVDGRDLGEKAAEELAAGGALGTIVPTIDDLTHRADKSGYAAAPRDAVRLVANPLTTARRDEAPWALGARAARALRAQEKLDQAPISDARLAAFAGVEPRIIGEDRTNPDFAFSLDRNDTTGRIALRSRWRSGRRFEIARLIGDRLFAPSGGRLHAATRAYTYRQQMQRSFAAELLSPFDAVEERLGGDYSSDAQTDVAEYFEVSELTIQTLLVNHRRLERGGLDELNLADAA